MSSESAARYPRVFMMDMWTTVPYYTAYLSRALLNLGVHVQVGSITYYLDRNCFRGRNLRLQPGCSDLVGRLNLPRGIRRVAKLLEGGLNLLALTARFAVRSPDIVHIQFLPLLRSRLPLDLFFVRYCKRRGARLVLTVHDLLPHDTGETHRAVYERLYAEMDALICHSETIRKRLISEFRVPEAKISVIPHGPFFYDLASGSRTPGEHHEIEKVVLWQGIIFPYKGVDLLLNAWQHVEARRDSLRLRILGTGDPSLLRALEALANSLQLKRVDFDFRFCSAEELVAAYWEAAMVVYPYRAITTSGALATGLALEKPIVASKLPVFAELLVDGENALLVDPADADQLASAILRIESEPGLAGRLRTKVAGMRFGDQSWREIGEATVKVYRKTLAS